MNLREGDFRGLSVLSRPPCYLTDQRNFSNERRASSRMHSMAKVDLADAQPNLTQWHRCDELVSVIRLAEQHCGDGEARRT